MTNHIIGFQSAPRARARGDAADDVDPVTVDLVSIRAPRAGAGRQCGFICSVLINLFQSAPRARARGDPADAGGQAEILRFNPRPARGRGATQQRRFQRSETSGFNPRPARGRGATTGGGGKTGSGRVSIRAPRAGAGRPGRVWFRARRCPFQSAPRARARGDLGLDRPHPDRLGFNPRPARGRGATG